MLDFIREKSQCTGCGACVSICPMSCISFSSDGEGFEYPQADSRCIDCGQCRDVCPALNHDATGMPSFEQFCVAGRHVDDSVWERSSSGGAFTAICQSYCKDGDGIFGARFDGTSVVHDCVCSPDKIGAFLRSKYVQSSLGGSYNKARDMLERGRKVLFSGTPCQVAGLRGFLNRPYDDLICIDLICHGVGSPEVFQRYVSCLETRYASKVVSFTFRNKQERRGRFLQYIVKVHFENGKCIEDESDLYNTGFIQCLFLRPSCGECAYASLDRVGDITIGDFKNQHELLPHIRSLKNMSTVMVNTAKGDEVFAKLGRYMILHPVELAPVVATNAPLRVPSKMSMQRDAFFRDLASGMSVQLALERHIAVPGPFRRIWVRVPDRARAAIKRGARWIRELEL